MKSRIRTFLVVAAALTSLSALAATPADAAWWSTPFSRVAATAVPAQITAGAQASRAAVARASTDVYSYAAPRPGSGQAAETGVCGPGFQTVHFSAGVACTHRAADPLPTAVAAGGSSVSPVAGPAVNPKCYGNGENGGRVQAIYAYLEGRPNRGSTYVPQILKTYIPHTEGAFRSTSKDEGREIGVRWFAPGCKIKVDVVRIPKDIGERANPDQFVNVIQYVYDQGYQDSQKRYVIWFDQEAASPGVCGTAVGPLPGDEPGPLNLNNGDVLFGIGANKVISKSGALFPTGYAVVFGPGCFTYGGDYTAATHELLHTLGAVASGSPNSNGAGHCTDGLDIMCYDDPKAPDGKRLTNSRCQTRVRKLDCGMDDYFAISPPAGTYLSTHWNVAQSEFLGDAVGIDTAPVVLPRP